MKNRIMQMSLVFGLMLGLTIFGKASPPSHYRAEIPFDFTVNGKLFKAGEYAINYGSLTSSQDILTIRSVKGRSATLVAIGQHQKIRGSGKPVIVFNLYKDGQYALSEIKTRNFGIKMKKRKTKNVRLAKNIGRVEITLVK